LIEQPLTDVHLARDSKNYREKTMKNLCGFVCVAVCLFLCVPANAASACNSITGNLVANCGFETGSFSSWTLSGNDVPTELNNLYGVEGTDPLDGISPHSGSDQAFFADLDANSTTMSQSIPTTVGGVYTVVFYLAQDTSITAPYSNDLSVSFGGNLFDSLTAIPVEGYTKYLFETTATSSSTLLSFKFGDDLGELLVDDISVTPTPEPPAWMLMLTGMLGLGLLSRRATLTARC
jgi:MYXO-CTERM domain-containing protein